jgi:hypothetical protein
MSYDYFNTVPLGHYFDCPDIAPSCTLPCDPTQTCCSSLSQSGYIFSDNFSDDLIASGTPKAMIYAGSTIDNNGSVGGVTFPVVPCEFGQLATLDINTVVSATIDGNKLKLPFTAENSALGGPYGLHAVFIKWYFTCV